MYPSVIAFVPVSDTASSKVLSVPTPVSVLVAVIVKPLVNDDDNE